MAEDPDDRFTISYMDDADELFFEQASGLEGVIDEIEKAFNCDASQILIKRQGDEEDG